MSDGPNGLKFKEKGDNLGVNESEVCMFSIRLNIRNSWDRTLLYIFIWKNARKKQNVKINIVLG